MESALLLAAQLAVQVAGRTVESPTPPMGWNSYNTWSCSPSEDKIKQSAQGLVDLGMDKLGYNFVTVDCGWPSRDRDADGRLQWNETLFPSGGKALGEFIHDLGLGYGLYSGAGYFQCGSTDLPASLGYEQLDAESFAEWGGDNLKYDNCYGTSKTIMADGTSAESQSPARFQLMAAELEAVDRDMQYFVCQWGIGTDIGEWASEIGNTWRISNDIYNAWRSIWRITNQVVPYFRHTKPGAFADMDMLIVGLNALSHNEEKFHFGMWAINKSPLIIGAALDKNTSQASIDIMSNTEIIAINQDALGQAAQLVRRYTAEEWDIWQGNLSGERQILGIANWRNDSQTVSFDLSTLGIASAQAHDPWTGSDLGVVTGLQTLELEPHDLALWVLSNIDVAPSLTSTEYHAAADAELSGDASVTQCAQGACLPVGSKVGNIRAPSTLTFTNVSSYSPTAFLAIDFTNYDYSFETSWEQGTNTRNLTISINDDEPKRWAFPLSGGDWEESGRLVVETSGWEVGDGNQVVLGGYESAFAPDIVGLTVLE